MLLKVASSAGGADGAAEGPAAGADEDLVSCDGDDDDDDKERKSNENYISGHDIREIDREWSAAYLLQDGGGGCVRERDRGSRGRGGRANRRRRRGGGDLWTGNHCGGRAETETETG
jgi:hypothetical protein